MRRLGLAAALLWLAAATASPVAAQSAAALVSGARVRVSAPRHHARGLTGSLLRVGGDSIWIRATRQDSTWTLNERNVWTLTGVAAPRDTLWAAPVDALTRVEVSRGRRSRAVGMARGMGKGLLYAGGAGALAGLFIRDPDGFFYSDPGGGAAFWGIVFGTVGGTIGGLYGLASPGERWQRIRLPLRQP